MFRGSLPPSRRQLEEAEKKKEQEKGNLPWHKTETPNIYINSKGQFKTDGYTPICPVDIQS